MRVLFLDLDTLRADHLGCYGYLRQTSPQIDRIAAQGVRFDNYYCSDAPCLPSRAALMSGRFGIHTGAVGHGGTAADLRLEGPTREFRMQYDQYCLPRIFRRAGMRTVTVSPFAERHSAYWFYGGFTEMYNTGKGGAESAEEITPTVLDWIDRNAADDDWFLHVNYWDPHAAYRAPAEFGNPFAGQPLPEWLTTEVIADHQRKVGPNSACEMNMYSDDPCEAYPRHTSHIHNMGELRHHIDGYDCGIRYMDTHIGQVFDALAARGVMDDLVVIISADHGENHGELGIYKEHATADQATCRIPMIVRWPGRGKAGHVDIGLHHNLDLAPTLAEMLAQEPHEAWDGQSYAAAITDGAQCGKDFAVISQCAHVCQRSVRMGGWLYMRTYHDGYHLFPDQMLFNIADDPHEQHDLATDRPDVVSEAAACLARWHEEMTATMGGRAEEDPLRTVMREGGPYHAKGHLREYCKRLETTGRAGAVAELKRRHPREFE